MTKNRFMRAFMAAPLLAAMSLPAQSFHSALPQASHNFMTAAAYKPSPATPAKKRVRRRSKKKSAAIVGGSAVGGAVVGGLVGGKKGAAVGALAGGGGGYVYDRKTQNKPIVPK